MTLNIKKTNSILLLAVILFNITLQSCFAEEVKEEKQFTELKNIDTGSVKTLENKSYDEAVTIKEIYVSGNSLVKTDDILNKLNLKPGTNFDRNLVQQDLRNIYQMGYFTEKIKAVPKQTGKGITLYIQVEENIPVTGFNIVGNKSVKTEEILQLLRNQQGLPQNVTELNDAIKNLEKLYAEKGYILARVEKVSDDPDGLITIKLNEGEIQDINVSGNTKTKDYVIKRNITLKPGEVYDENKMKKDLARLFGTQAFSDVRRVISISPDNPDKYNVTVEVDEKRTGSISIGGGIDTETGLFGSVGYADNNFRGRGQELSTNCTLGSGVILDNSAVVDKLPLQFQLNFVEPRLKNSLNSLRSTAFLTDMASYQVPLSVERRYGGEIELARPIKKVQNLAGSFSMGVEKISLREGDEGGIKEKFDIGGYTDAFRVAERTKELKGGTYLSLGPGVVYDTRNSIVSPTDGWYSTASFKESFMIFGDAGTYGKIQGSVKRYFPVGKNSTILLNGRAAAKAVGNLPEFAAFRLGGPYSVRGFREGDVGNGDGFLMASAEFRTPVPLLDRVKYNFVKNIRLAFFADAGTILNENFISELYNRPGYGISIGSGLLVPIPMLGPIRFDYGYPITSTGSGNKKGAFSFAVGER